MSIRPWTDHLGRTYTYEPYEAAPIAEIHVALSEASAFAVAEGSRAIGSVSTLPLAGTASVIYRSEASASSIIEDLTVGPRRILEAQIADPGELRDPIAELIVGNLEGLRDALATPYPATFDDILRWHRILMAGHRRMALEDIGVLRRRQNWIGGDAFGPRNTAFIPPPPEDVPAHLDDLIRYLERTDVAPVVQASIAHARFEAIHPFTDGNGRVGRMLLQHVLTHRAEAPVPIPVSVPWSRDKDRYIEGLQHFQSGELDPWIEFAAGSMVLAVEWITSAQDRVSRLLTELQGRSNTRSGSAAAGIIDDLVEYPLVDGSTVAARYGVSRQAAHQALERLAAGGILTKRPFSRRTKGRPRMMYASTELIDLLGAIVTDD